jgi:hypothetical protein
MEEGQPADEIIKELTTRADKIRALAHANYDRTEISKTLGIGYQNVRQVQLRSGIKGGLRRPIKLQRELVTVDPAPKSRPATSWQFLISAGFRLLGEWRAIRKAPCGSTPRLPAFPGVYAVVVDDVVVYVGLTKSGLQPLLRGGTGTEQPRFIESETKRQALR